MVLPPFRLPRSLISDLTDIIHGPRGTLNTENV